MKETEPVIHSDSEIMGGKIFLTADRNLSYQQDLSAFDIAIVVLVARSNRLEDLRALVPRLLEVLPTAARRAVTLVQR